MLALVLGERTYRFPDKYVDAFGRFVNRMASYADPEELPEGLQAALGNRLTEITPSPTAAKYFARTGWAGDIIREMAAGFDRALEEIKDPIAVDSIDAEKFAELIGVNEQTVDAWRRAGLEVTTSGINGRRVIPVHALRDFYRWQDPRRPE